MTQLFPGGLYTRPALLVSAFFLGPRVAGHQDLCRHPRPDPGRRRLPRPGVLAVRRDLQRRLRRGRRRRRAGPAPRTAVPRGPRVGRDRLPGDRNRLRPGHPPGAAPAPGDDGRSSAPPPSLPWRTPWTSQCSAPALSAGPSPAASPSSATTSARHPGPRGHAGPHRAGRQGNPPFATWQGEHPDVALATFADAAAGPSWSSTPPAGTPRSRCCTGPAPTDLAEKVLVDVANPLDFSAGFPPTLSVKDTDSLAERVQRAVPGPGWSRR